MNRSSVKQVDKDQVCWFVMRAYKAENRVEEKLSEQEELGYFIAKQYVIRVYHGKKTRKLVPIISSIIFVHGTRNQIAEFKKGCEQLQYVMWPKATGPEYMTVPDNQMESFIRIASDLERKNTYYRPEEIHLGRNTRVRIHGGALDGVEGYFVRVKDSRNRKLVVVLDGLTALATEVSPDLVEVIDNDKVNEKQNEK